MYLHEKLAALREYGGLKSLPEFVAENLNPRFELRPYQRQAFENFITHIERANCPKPTQVLFHMATGSGKTLIMAGLIIYLYTRGYRNFLFFVNLSNIVGKTRENFLEAASSKYLFAEEIILDGKRIRVIETENFEDADPDAINICFETTQGLHTALNLTRENGMTFEDFDEREIVLISDEAHHLNAETTAAAENNRATWENTIEHLFKRNAKNILLEFTATCNLENPQIRAKYEDKIIFNYPLQNFYNDGYSKDIITIRTELEPFERALTALILSQYRLKIFQDNRLNVKPVVLFKARTIAESREFQAEFDKKLSALTTENLRGISESRDAMIRRAFEYFNRRGINLETLAAELREDFSAEHCISANDAKDTGNNRDWLNTLEAADNPYRAVFEVKKLDEGWDVLNLFDIVRLYETRSRANTLSEAQLIGRGARYFPFELDGGQKYQRKFDSDADNDLRACETLYYHCQNDSAYISELHRALHDLGLDLAKIVRREYKLKPSFMQSEFYRSGVIWVNGRIEVGRQDVREKIAGTIYSFRAGDGGGHDKLMAETLQSGEHSDKLQTIHKTIGELAAINYAVVNKALLRLSIYDFDTLKNYFPDLKSTREFITDEKYLGGISISSSEPTLAELYDAVCYVAGKVAEVISQSTMTYRGDENFFPRRIRKVFRDKTINFSETHEGGIGFPQADVDLSAADWFAYNDNYGTAEEKAFVKYFSEHIAELRAAYDKIYLVRNERAFHVYAFEDGARFEPDFVLFLQREDDCEQWQIFIEPKGEHLTDRDAWKEKFLLQLKDAVKISDDARYRIWGLPFFTQENLRGFDKEFRALL